ncbi:hypothetical protein SAMN05421752_10760 [Natronorubrum thiooxidans]|uniref:Right handed beta helix region n=2 Tax=Natronorubrum thiooxidans TaxID=308853 RepID=A0A1N7FK11_9EURY|nr:hypothetical protein SAMN05421752_10760 [Natronorubrum thiooxidans]
MYLKGVAGVGATIAASMGVSASDGDYEEVVVDAYDSVTYTVGSGETLENLLIDISAPHAKFYIRANGRDWTVRNIGIKGTWDDDTKEEPFIVNVSSGGTGHVENFYWADGTAPFDKQRTYGGAATGCYIANAHSGTLVMENLNLQGFSDNGVYGSSPGDLPSHPSGGGGNGQVIIRNSYAANCAPAGFRLGSDGSRLENCVVTNCTRNYWGFYRDTEIVDCDLSDTSQHGDIVVSDSHWDDNATVTVENTYFERTGKHGSKGRVVGSSADRTPRTRPDQVEGVPLTPEEAALGSSSAEPSLPSNGDDGTRDEDDDSDEDEIGADDRHLLAFVTDTNARNARYEFTAEGPVDFASAPYDSPSGGNIEGGPGNDSIDEANGAVHVNGLTGGGFGDAFTVEGPITEINIKQPDVMWAELNGEQMTPEEIVTETAGDAEDDSGSEDENDDESDHPPNAIVIDATETRDTADYSFEVSGSVEKATHHAATIDDGDSVEGTAVKGAVDDSKDAYWFSGDITDFWLNGNAFVDVEYGAE